MRKLVITEKFNTALRIAVVLSDGEMKRERHGPVAIFRFSRKDGDYTVMGLRGHIVELDYPEDLARWDLRTLPKVLEATPLRNVTERAIVSTLREVSPGNDELVLATDWDREGEVIAAECLEIIMEVAPRITVRRAQYSAMNKGEIEKAFAELKTLDRNLADAGMARQYIDLMWGALLTRYLTLVSREGLGGGHSSVLSVGRVQTPTLALLIDRDKQIRSFRPEPFWEITATVELRGDTFQLKHSHGRWSDKKEAEASYLRVKAQREGVVRTFLEAEERVRPPVPFSTTLFITEVSRLGLSASHAMRIAEELYTGGAISYPRTDNTVYPRSLALRSSLEMLSKGFLSKEAEYVLSQEKIRATRGRQETTDHPPIYPTGNIDVRKVNPDKAKVYELIVRRFLATTAPDAIGTRRKTEIDVSGELLVGDGFKLRNRGWYTVYPYYQTRESDLPVLKPGERVRIMEVLLHEGKTEPPRRYTQGSLIQEMERLGLGTKSTRHEIVQKLVERRYIVPRGLEPTTSGLAVTEALETNASLVTRPDMTSRLEEDMTSIAKGDKSLTSVVEESRDMLREVYALLVDNVSGVRDTLQGALDKQHFAGPCPTCGGALRIHASAKGSRWIQCANNPRSCTVSYPLPSSGHVEPAGVTCTVCRVPMVRIVNSGQVPKNYCVNPLCEVHQKEYAIGICPSCGSPLHVKYSFRGKRFVACTGFPKCRVSYPLPQNGRLDKHPSPCEACGAPVVTVVRSGRPPWTICINMECSSRKQGNVVPEKVPEAKAEAEVGVRKPRGRKRGAGQAQRSRSTKVRAPATGWGPDQEMS